MGNNPDQPKLEQRDGALFDEEELPILETQGTKSQSAEHLLRCVMSPRCDQVRPRVRAIAGPGTTSCAHIGLARRRQAPGNRPGGPDGAVAMGHGRRREKGAQEVDLTGLPAEVADWRLRGLGSACLHAGKRREAR